MIAPLRRDVRRGMRADHAPQHDPAVRSARRRRAALLAVAALIVAGCAADSGPGETSPPLEATTPAEAPAGPDTRPGDEPGAEPGADDPTVRTAPGPLGTHLVDADGMALYLFTDDSPGVSVCVDACLATWPALTIETGPVAGRGVDAALLGTLTRDDGSRQVTYAGWPLYRYAGDTQLGDTTGQAVNDVWFLIAPDGGAITATAAEQPMDSNVY
jgi:predicted lipoprotein with Yx(FWY)xxD motif